MKTHFTAAVLIANVLLMGLADERAAAIEREQIDRLVKPYLDSETVVGLSVGVIADGKRQSFGYGRLQAGDDKSPDGKTVYEIGSITKVFTGVLLADAVARNEVQLDQPIQELLPDNVELTVKEKPILLRHLSTHTSGLPRLPNNMRPLNPLDPYADYTVEQMYEFLGAHQPAQAPEKLIAYSNLGTGLLGHLLGRKAGMSYEQLVKQRIAEPLGMASTAIELSAEMKQRLAAPHLADGSAGVNWAIPAMAGAGDICSTTEDMLKFAAAQLDPPDGELGKAIELAWQAHQQPLKQTDFAMGLGWHIARDGDTRWHNGETGGYHSMMLVSRKLDVAVVVLTNTATGEVDRLAEDLVRMLAGAEVEPRKFAERKEVAVPAKVLQRYVGRYPLTPAFVLTVTAEGDQLYVQATGQQKFRVFAKSETEWFYKVVDAQLTFQVDDDGNCTAVVLHQGGRDMTAKKYGK